MSAVMPIFSITRSAMLVIATKKPNVGAARGDDTDAQILGQLANGGKRLVFSETAAEDLGLYLGVDLLVYGGPASIVYEYLHGRVPPLKGYGITVYIQYAQSRALCQGGKWGIYSSFTYAKKAPCRSAGGLGAGKLNIPFYGA